MIIGILRIELGMYGNSSLKDKRMIIKSLRDRIRNKFNVSVAEIDNLDKWQKADLGVVTLGTDKRYVNRVLCKVIDFIKDSHSVELIDYELEMI